MKTRVRQREQIVDAPVPGTVAAGTVEEPPVLQHGCEDGVQNCQSYGETDDDIEHRATDRQDKVAEWAGRAQECLQIRSAEENGGYRNEFRRDRNNQSPENR